MLPTVRLEPLSLVHLPQVMTWVNDKEVLQYFANLQKPVTEAEERTYLEKLLASKVDRAWSIFVDEDYVGQCSLNQIYWPAKNARAFLVIRKEHQQKGCARAAIPALLEKAWAELGLHKVWLIVRRDNRTAQSLYLRLGFDFEGVLRDEYFVQDRFHDMVRMAIVRPAS